MVIFMVIMSVTMLMAVTLGNHYLAVEGEAIEEHLARLRVRWAMVGMVDYALSRARAAGSLTADDTGKLPILQSYFDELDGVVNYDALSSEYQFTLAGATALASGNPGDGTNDTGRIALTVALNALGNTPVLKSLENSMPKLVMEACLRPEPGEIPGPDALFSSECQAIDPSAANGESWIRAYYWTYE